MSQAFYRKWRPLGWDELVGQDHVSRTLKNAIALGNFAHAYLFSGPRGTGKTTTARIIAKAANCLAEDSMMRPCNSCENCQAVNQGRFLDLIEIDAASNTSVDDVRDLREKINYSPSIGRYKVYIIDEVHMLSNAAFNALLKTLEEPPNHAIFVLATTEMHKIPATVLSRCQRHEFRRIPLNLIQALLKEISEKEKIEIEPAAITAIARQATGSMRDAISLLDQLASAGSSITLEYAQQVLGTSTGNNIYNFVESLFNESGSSLDIINIAMESGTDPRQFSRQIVDLLRSVLLAKFGQHEKLETTNEELQRIIDFSKKFSIESIIQAIQAFEFSSQQKAFSWQPGLNLEIAAIKVANKPSDLNILEPEKTKSSIHQHTKAYQSGELSIEKTYVKNQNSGEKNSKDKTELENQISVATPLESGKPEIDAISERWRDILSASGKISQETRALLNSVKSYKVKDGILTLFFASQLLKEKMQGDQNITNAKNAIRQTIDAEIAIDCRVAENASMNSQANTEKNDGILGTARQLGAKITKKDDPE